MKKLLLTLFALLAIGGGKAWAQTITWESKSGWEASEGGNVGIYWFGAHTPGDATKTYHFTSLQLMQLGGNSANGGTNNYIAIARASATSTLNADQVVAISDNAVTPTGSDGSLHTYNFSAGVDLLGGTTYYIVFLSSNTPTNGTYPVCQGRLRINHQGTSDPYNYGEYPYGNSNGNKAWWPYYTATVEESSTTGFCTGDILGGSMASGNWKDSWTSGTTPSFTMKSNANNINNSSSKPAGGLDIRSGSAESATYTITAPTGYVITGYKLFGNAITSANTQTVTPAEGGSAVGFTGAGNSINVSGLRNLATSFTLTGKNTGLFIHAMQVSLASANSITTLPTENNKAYVITNARGTWNFADNASSMNAVTFANTNLNNVAHQIALIYKNENYYLFSVNAGKYLTADNTLTSMPTNDEQVDIVATGNSTYPWFFRFKNKKDANDKYTNNINISQGVIKIDGWGPNGSNSNGIIDEGNRNAIIEAVDFNAETALAMFDVRNVTYNLSYDGNATFRTVSNVSVTIGGDPAEFVPTSFVTPGVTLSYSPATIAAGTTEVTVTAVWNGPFDYTASFDAASASWYTLGIQSSYIDYNYRWTYNGTDNVKPQSVATDDYAGVTNQRLFCFVGNPYDGFKIYNAAAGNGYTLRKDGENVQVTMSSTDDNNTYIVKESRTNTFADGYFCLKPTGNNYYLNYDKNNDKLGGWDDNDQGSTCWVVAPGEYYLNFIDGLVLEAPVGAVGTRAYFQSMDNVETIKGYIRGYRTTVAANMNSGELSSLNSYLDPIKASDVITLANGYYRFVNAYTNWASTKPTIYYNSANNRIEWSVASNDSHNVNSIFRVDAATPSIFSPNAQKYMSVINATVSGSLSDEQGTTVFTSLGSAQYNVVVGSGTMHTAGHSSGAGTSGNLTSWGGGSLGTADAWYIVKVDAVDLTLNDGGDGSYYATLCLPFDVTISGATAYTMALSGDYLVPTAITEIPAGTPVLLKGSSNAAKATINTGSAFSTSNVNALEGTFTDKAVTAETDYFLGTDGTTVGFYKWTGTTLAANRAYLTAATVGEVKGFAINWDSADAIKAIENAKTTTDGAIYNLAGQRMSKMQRGINIVNGKKVIIK